MIDVNEYIKKAIKKQLFQDQELNKSSRQVLSQLKTKYKDIQEEITVLLQNKLLTKMLNEREKAIKIYQQAEGGEQNLKKQQKELEVIKTFLRQIYDELPKQLNEQQVLNIIKEKCFINIGECMKYFNINYKDQEKKMISQVWRKYTK